MPSSNSTTRLAIGGAATLVMMLLAYLVAPALTIWHRGRLAAHLADQVANCHDSAVKVPLRQLAELGRAGLEPLIIAAASERATVSTIARQIIDEKMAGWKSLAAASTSLAVDPDFVISMNIVAANLAVHIDQFGPTGKQWAERLALAMIDLAEILPVRQSAVLLADCSKVFASVPPRGPTVRTLKSLGDAIPTRAAPTLETPQLRLEPMTRASDGSLEILARLPPRSHDLEAPVAQQQPLKTAASLKLPQRAVSELAWAPKPIPQPDQPTDTPHVTTRTRIQPTPTQRHEPVSNRVLDVPTPQEMHDHAVVLRQVSTDELLVRLGGAGFFQAGIVRQVLGERGFTDADLEFMQRLASPEVEDRIRLVDDVSMLPAARARRLLGWLLADASADVRLRALTALATTHSSDLADLARELALHDDDPRVAELASRLLREVR